MSFDIRRASKEELDRLNEEARAWKAQQSKESGEAANQDVQSTQEPLQQLDLNLE